MAQMLLLAGALIFLLLGLGHGALAVRDVWRPRAFTPTDDKVRTAMQGSELAFSRRIKLWQAWLGFNLSHSLGLVIFGGGLLAVAWLHFPAYARSPLTQIGAILVAAAYLLLSVRFWFRGPVIGTGTGLACFVASALLLQLG